MLSEEPTGYTHQEHDHNHWLILQVSNNINFGVSISSVGSPHWIGFGNVPVVPMVIVLVRVVWRESVHVEETMFARIPKSNRGDKETIGELLNKEQKGIRSNKLKNEERLEAQVGDKNFP